MQRFPVGYYVLGIELKDVDELFPMRRPNIVHRWSVQAFTTFLPGESRSYESIIQRPAKAFTAHAWGLCRLVSVGIATDLYLPQDGALFIDIERIIEPGCVLRVIIEALDFEPLAQ